MWLMKHEPSRLSAVKEALESKVEACMQEEDEKQQLKLQVLVIQTQRKLKVMIGMLTSHSQSRFTERVSLRSVIKANAAKLVSAWLEGPPKKKT
jgi:hypothetical protein